MPVIENFPHLLAIDVEPLAGIDPRTPQTVRSSGPPTVPLSDPPWHGPAPVMRRAAETLPVASTEHDVDSAVPPYAEPSFCQAAEKLQAASSVAAAGAAETDRAASPDGCAAQPQSAIAAHMTNACGYRLPTDIRVPASRSSRVRKPGAIALPSGLRA